MQQQHVRFERVRPGVPHDLAEQPADRLEQHEPIAVGGRRAFLLERLGNGGKPGRRDRAEG
ncbi:MAG: hypothetical protein DMD38_07140 [Gemmatimonadetes bacterium]|nr:MAG: hypothetical protein DMD38_07140 [Gemmatimonadota bacterium]